MTSGSVVNVQTCWMRGGVLFAAAASLLALGCGSGVEPYRPSASGGAAAGTGGTGPSATGGSAAPGSGGRTTVPGSGGVGVSGTGGRPVGTGNGTGGIAATGGTGAPASGGSSVGTGVLLTLPWMDNFEDATVGAVPAQWLADPADVVAKWAVTTDAANKVLQETVTASSISLIVGGDRNWTDQRVEAKVKFAAVTSSSLALVAARFVTVDDYYALNLKGDGSLKIRKRIVVGGGTSTLDVLSYKSGAALVAGTWYTVAIQIKGNEVTAYLNGAAVATATETAVSLAKGGIALGFQGAAGSFDDVKVTLP